MSLRITYYSAPALTAHPDSIHVEGDMGGAGCVGSVVAHDDDEDVRRVHGAVSMLPDEIVRWSLVSLSQLCAWMEIRGTALLSDGSSCRETVPTSQNAIADAKL